MQCNNSYARYFEIKYNLIRDGAGDHCAFRRREPTMLVFVIYAFVLPSLALFGLCANFINAIVFMRPKMTPSAFTYLAALSWLDCISCLLITLTTLSRSIFFHSTFWLAYDLKWQTPLFGITTGAANLILACVSVDRLVYLWKGIPNGTPRFCRRNVARRMIIGVVLISSIVNFPYFFVFVVNSDGTFQTTDFYYSKFYKIHNWFTFILLAILPAILLLIGNAAILIAFRRWTKQSQVCDKHCKRGAKNTQKRYQHQMKLTITILIVITLYLIGELPAHLTSRKSALNLLYSGDVSKVNFHVMERLEIICMSLNVVQLSMNIMVYALINPSFVPEFFVCLRGASDACFRLCCCCCTLNGCFKICSRRKKRLVDVDNDPNFWSDEHSIDDKIATKTKAVPKTNKPIVRHECYNQRSFSLGNFVYDNFSLQDDYYFLDKIDCSMTKRHSMPAYLEKESQNAK